MLFSFGLNRGECASWVQAWGSIIAIVAAVSIAVWQAKKQQKVSMDALSEGRRLEHIRMAQALRELATNSLSLQRHVVSQLPNRQDVHDVAEGHKHLDLSELGALERSLESIDLHSLPASLISLSLVLRSTVRQFREMVIGAMQIHRQMDADAFKKFFDIMGQMNTSLEKTINDFDEELKKILPIKA
jgi:hypothetical protein